jgi:ectoine hydroxylase-related dioxygenase (phytanoyl-CoA dioxygenase family)
MLNQEMRKLLAEAAPDYTIIKSIYFDKAPGANWFVSFHRDQIIFVKNKIEAWGFKNWTNRGDCFGVQPSPDILGNMVTIRIHLDDADQNNGALKVIPYTHSEATVRSVNTNFSDSDSVLCPVRAGGVMLMKPLLFHASSKSASDKRRRVIHLELCGMELPEGMEWAQKTTI